MESRRRTIQKRGVFTVRDCLWMPSIMGRLSGASWLLFCVTPRSIASRTTSPGSRTGNVCSSRAYGEREDRRIRADSKPQGENRNHGESRCTDDLACSEADVLQYPLHAVPAPRLPRLVPQRRQVPERPQRRMPSLFRAHPRGNVFRNLLLQMKPQLIIQSVSRATSRRSISIRIRNRASQRIISFLAPDLCSLSACIDTTSPLASF